MNSVSVQGDLVSSGSEDKSAQVWNMRTKQKLWQFQHEDKVWCVQLHENWLISCSNDKSTRIWDLGDGKQIHRFGQSSPCGKFDISPDKSLLAIICTDQLVLLDFSKGTRIKRLNLGWNHTDVRFNPSGTRLIVGLFEGEVFKVDMAFDSETDEEYEVYSPERSFHRIGPSYKNKDKKGSKATLASLPISFR